MGFQYTHTCIVSRDADRLAAFYESVLGCRVLGPAVEFSGENITKGMGLPRARVRGVNLALPGFGSDAPLLEIFELGTVVEADPEPDRLGYMHIGITVDDLETVLGRVIGAGGSLLGEIALWKMEGVGEALYVYVRDPDGNIVELVEWQRRDDQG